MKLVINIDEDYYKIICKRVQENKPFSSPYEYEVIADGKPLEQKPRWVSVKEKLPEENLAVLVWCPTRKNIYCACYEEKQWWIFGAYWEKVTEEIVAWQPLPTNPYIV